MYKVDLYTRQPSQVHQDALHWFQQAELLKFIG